MRRVMVTIFGIGVLTLGGTVPFVQPAPRRAEAATKVGKLQIKV